MSKPEVIPYRVWQGTENPQRRASVWGVAPPRPAEIVVDGWTILWPDGTSGHPKLTRDMTREQVEAFAAERFASGFRGFAEY